MGVSAAQSSFTAILFSVGLRLGAHVLEVEQAAYDHVGPRGGTIVVKQVGESLDQELVVVLVEASLLRERGGYITLGRVQAVGHDVLLTHRSFCALLCLFLLGYRATRYCHLERRDRVE